MTVPIGNSTQRTAADVELIDSLSGRDVIEFRNHIYSPAFIRANAAFFHDREWIDTSELRQFLRERGVMLESPVESAAQSAQVVVTASVKNEPREIRVPHPAVKPESIDHDVVPPADPVRMRLLQEDGHDVFELLSSESELDDDRLDSDAEVSRALMRASRSSKSSESDSDSEDDNQHATEQFHIKGELQESDTIWQDPGITSLVIIGKFRITAKLTVERIEYVMPHGVIPSVWPNPRVPTAFILNLGSNYDAIDPKTGVLYTVDWLIKNHDNDSWKSNGSGKADGEPKVIFDPGQHPIPCRRARMSCKGAHACERIDPKLIEVVRYDLDPASRTAVFAAQQDTRRREGTTAEDITAGFFDIVDKKRCPAVDSKGNPCQGRPKLMPKKEITRGHQYWVACDGWRKDFKENHRTCSIPDYVDEALLVKLFAGEPIVDGDSKDTQACSRIVPPRTGLKQKHCPHTHIVEGRVVTRSKIKQYPCQAKRTIYVPEDPSIRKALVVHKPHTPHSHPMPPLVKASLDVKETYTTCVETSGPVGATVNKVDNAKSTRFLLGGQTPAMFSPALGNNRVKREIVHKVKSKKYPAGLGAAGAFQLFLEDKKNPPHKRYIHCYRTTDDGSVLIITGVPFLIKLLDDPGVLAFDDDTTFKRVAGEMNEWELAFFFKAVQRALTAIRAYVNRSSADFFEILFDELQEIKKCITGKVLGMKRFVSGGNLLVMNADMEAAQVLGAARSIMKTNEPEYSGIPNDMPASEAATYFVKVCCRHSKEAIHDFKGLVTPAQYERLSDFMYIDSKERLNDFSKFVKGLGVKKIQDWWAHKEMSDWIIPCLVKSQSNIHPADWDSTPATTNTGETQHHWTNTMTGINLSLVEAIESARELDENTAREIEASLNNGILANSQNEAYHRMSRNLQRQSKAAQKNIAAELAELKEGRRQSSAREKELREQLKDAKATAGGSSKKRSKNSSASRSVVVSASSTGRVRTAPVVPAPATPVAVVDIPAQVTPASATALAAPQIVTNIPAGTASAELSELDGTQWASFDFNFEFEALTSSSAALDMPFDGLDGFTMASVPVAGAESVPNFWGPADLNALVAAEMSAPMIPVQEASMLTRWEPTTLDELLTSSLFEGSSTDTTMRDFSADFSANPLPTLHAPPSPSGSAPSPPNVPLTVVPRKRRAEVDEANILHSSRVRTKSAKLQASDEAPVPKKRQNVDKLDLGCGLIVPLTSAAVISNQASRFTPPFSTDSRSEGAQHAEGAGAGPGDLVRTIYEPRFARNANPAHSVLRPPSVLSTLWPCVSVPISAFPQYSSDSLRCGFTVPLRTACTPPRTRTSGTDVSRATRAPAHAIALVVLEPHCVRSAPDPSSEEEGPTGYSLSAQAHVLPVQHRRERARALGHVVRVAVWPLLVGFWRGGVGGRAITLGRRLGTCAAYRLHFYHASFFYTIDIP
ncbi:hypothetical protein MVEN_02608400 [Mycena venus]|uniref:Uncharacterized protein n=1 Tax=Mycena venus TaxID=2733690 RepID=A0A8H6WR08_9AGAR|nr:hypothetical protein MVEN_02608400 [Mycena venus]